jgi:hypothetical protein
MHVYFKFAKCLSGLIDYHNTSTAFSKLDVARMLIEDIRATVTEESRRKALIDSKCEI